jgi:hypothetical protein
MKNMYSISALLSICIWGASCQKDAPTEEVPIVIAAIGDIAPTVASFKTTVGNLNTTTGVSFGRREINWDGIPDSFALVNIPSDFFNPVDPTANAQLQRGIAYERSGNFRVSSNGFSDIRTQAIADVKPFSGGKTFANVSAFAWPVEFEVAGQRTKAAVKSFAVVFTGVNLANTTFIEPFDGQKSLGKFFAIPYNGISNHSFVGVHFSTHKITSVNIVHGNGLIASTDIDIANGGNKDLVALDDIIYSEPVAQ